MKKSLTPPTPPVETHTIPLELKGKRLDSALQNLWPQHSRARLQGLLEAGQVTVDTTVATKASAKVRGGETVALTIPAAINATPLAQDIPLTIVYEDADLLVIDKPAGMVVHPAAGHADGTLVNALLAHCADSLSGINGVKRPGIVHRLDKETSGLMLVAKNDTAHNGLAAQFADHSARRTYAAVVHGLPVASGTVETLIGRDPHHRQRQAVVSRNGKNAITHFTRKQVFANAASLVECELETGRTHQIRVHMQHLGYPLVGDPLYGKKRAFKNVPDVIRAFPRQALHAMKITFTHPRTGKKHSYTSALPADMQDLILALQNTSIMQ